MYGNFSRATIDARPEDNPGACDKRTTSFGDRAFSGGNGRNLTTSTPKIGSRYIAGLLNCWTLSSVQRFNPRNVR
jgi:hypothetical protein